MISRKQPRQWTPPTKAEVRAAIDRSGYPLELRVCAMLEKQGFQGTHNWRWLDSQTSRTREVDITSERMFYPEEGTLTVHLLVECKTAAPGTVLFAFEGTLPAMAELAIADIQAMHQWGLPTAVLSSPGAIGGSSFLARYRWGRTLWNRSAKLATQFSMVKTQQNGTVSLSQDDAYDATEGLVQGFLAYKRHVGLVAPGGSAAFVNVGVLLLVVDGPLYVHAMGRGRGKLSRAPWGTLIRRAGAGYPGVARIDVVRTSALPAYLRALAADAATLRDRMSQEKALLRESLERFPSAEPR